MHKPWIQAPSQNSTVVFDFSPFRFLHKRSHSRTKPSMISIVGDLSKMLDTECDTQERFGSVVQLASGLPYITFLNICRLDSGTTKDNVYSQCIKKLEIRDQKPGAFVVRSSHALSDIVLFIASNIDEAVDQLYRWVEECLVCKPQDQPSAFIILETRNYQKIDRQTLERAFSKSCQKKAACKAQTYSNFEKMKRRAFRNIDIVISGAPSRTFPKAILDELEVSRKYRAAKCHLWSYETFCDMAENIVILLAERLQDRVEYVRVLDSRRLQPVLPIPQWIINEWSAWFQNAETESTLTEIQIPLLASCLANNALKLGHVFRPLEVFDSLYRKDLKESLDSQRILPVKQALKRLETHMIERVNDYTSGRASLKITLQEHSDFLKESPSSKLCLGCFFSTTEHCFDCGCSLCETCCKFFGESSDNSPVYSFERCPLCNSKLEAYRVRLPALKPFGYRILALDPGGVKGIVQLELLSAIQRQLGLPLQIFFDLIVGTSVGGINALALGLLQWPVERCKASLQTLAKDVFKAPNGWLRWLGRWPEKVDSFSRAILQDGVYDMNHALEKTFGDSKMIGPRRIAHSGKIRDHIKVAVITTEAQSSKCSLFTSYNKTGHLAEKSYGWVQEGLDPFKTKMLDAAHFTAAAPFFFPAKGFKLSKKLYQDGFNMPLPQAQAEGRKLWPSRTGPDYIISVGCGILRAIDTTRMSWIYRFVHSALTSWDANRQWESFRLANSDAEPTNCERVDAVLDMDEISLDDVAAMPKMQKEVQHQLINNKALHRTIRKVAFKMLSALFYFEFLSMPNFIGQSLHCRGSINCRYDDDGAIMDIVGKLYNKNLTFSINGREYPFENRKNIQFKLVRWHDTFDIKFNGGGYSASISGFPQAAASIVRFQHSIGQQLLPDDHKPARKRKFQEIAADS